MVTLTGHRRRSVRDRGNDPSYPAAMASPEQSPVEFALRAADEGELSLLIDIDDDACQLYEASGVPLGLLADTPYALTERSRWSESLREGDVLIATVGGSSVGFASFGMIDGEPYLDQLSVRLAAMGRGIGSALIERSVAWARERGGTSLWLTTYGHLPFNRPMYERRGFVVVEEKDCGPEIRHHLDEQRSFLPRPDARVAMRRAIG